MMMMMMITVIQISYIFEKDYSHHILFFLSSIIFHLYHLLEKDVMETYRENAMKLFTTLMDDVRRNTVYSLFIYKPNRK
jgi:hypothetical protein